MYNNKRIINNNKFIALYAHTHNNNIMIII